MVSHSWDNYEKERNNSPTAEPFVGFFENRIRKGFKIYLIRSESPEKFMFL